MSPSDGFDPRDDDNTSSFEGGLPSDHPRWPHVHPFRQAQIERAFFEEGATIHFERLPSLQWWAPLALTKDSLRVYMVTHKVVQASKLAHRRLTAAEIDGTSESAALSARYFSWILPSAEVGALALCWSTRKRFKFPFYQPKARKFDPRIFPMKSLPIWRGATAIRAWHLARFLCYFPLAWAGSMLFYASVVENTYEARLLKDPRLRGLIADMRKNHGHQAQIAKQGQQQHQQQQQQNYPGHLDMNTPQSSQETYPPTQFPSGSYTPESASQSYQDYSRDTYGSQSGNGFSGPRTGSDGSPAAPSPRSSWSRKTQPQAPYSTPQNSVPSESSSRDSDYDSDLFDDDDDASPVSAASRRAEASQARSTQGGSAWDRIRQQAQSGSSQWDQGDSSGQERSWGRLRQDKTQNSREGQPRTEGFAYTDQDEERERRNYEKEQAQREFDALLEAERRGGSDR